MVTFGNAEIDESILNTAKIASMKLVGKITVDEKNVIVLKSYDLAKKILNESKQSYIRVLNAYISNPYISKGAQNKILQYGKYIKQIESLETSLNKEIIANANKTFAQKYFFSSFKILPLVIAIAKPSYERYEFAKEREELHKDFPNIIFEKGEWDMIKQNPKNYSLNFTLDVFGTLIESATFGLTTIKKAGGSILDDEMPLGDSNDAENARQEWLSSMLYEFHSNNNSGLKWFNEPSNHDLNIAIYCFLQIFKDVNSKAAIMYGLIDYHQLDWLKYYKARETYSGSYHVEYDAELYRQDQIIQNIVYGALPFPDIKIPEWAESVIRKAKAQNITLSGYTSGALAGSFGPTFDISNIEVLAWAITAYGINHLLSYDEPLLREFNLEVQKDWVTSYYKYFIQSAYFPNCGITKDNLTKPATRETVAKLLFNVFKLPIRRHFGSYSEDGENEKLNSIREHEVNDSWFYEAAVIRKLGVTHGQCPIGLDNCTNTQREFYGSRNISRIEALSMIVSLNSYRYCNNSSCSYEEYFKGK